MRSSEPYFHKANKEQLSFTQREMTIIRLLCRQLSNKEIAAELGTSPRTVETQRKNIISKTGSRNIVGVVLVAIRSGLHLLPLLNLLFSSMPADMPDMLLPDLA
jgi:DNA-binding CsgD family transcriptional regulator